MTFLGYIQLASEVLAFITSMIVAGSLMRNKWWTWIPFLLYTCVVEISGAYLKVTAPKSNNFWLYNPYIIVSLTFYGWFVIHNTELSSKTKTVLYTMGTVLSLFSLIWYVRFGDPRILISSILNIGSVIICILCLLFFYMHIKNPVKYNSLTEVPAFWMVSGVLVFHTGISIYIAIYSFLAAAGIQIMGITIQNLIPQVLSLFLYGTIIAGLIKWRYQLRT
jgi:drug/metabolite transporter superfamily protein YnfA